MEIFIEGYAAIFGACENGVRIAPRCSFIAMDDVVLTLNHLSRTVRLASLRAGSLELFSDRTGLAFSMAVEDTDPQAGSVLRNVIDMPYCSFLGDETPRVAADGVKEITDVALRDVCLTATPWFSATGAWRSDAAYYDLPRHLRALRGEFERGIKRPHERTPVPRAWNYRPSSTASASPPPRALARRPGLTRPAAAADPVQAAGRAYDRARRAWEARRAPSSCWCGEPVRRRGS